MVELIAFPAGDETVWSFLDTELQASFAGVHAAGLIPSPRPAEFVRVRLSGGTDLDMIRTEPTVLVECYASAVGRAKQIAMFCHSVLLRGARTGWLGSAATRSVTVISLPQDLPDPLTSQARFSATYAVQLRGHPA